MSSGWSSTLQPQALVREQRGEVLEPGPLTGQLGIQAVHLVDAQQRGVLLPAVGRAAGALQEVTPAQAQLAGLLDRDVDVVLAGQVTLDPQEAVALVTEVQEPGDVDRLALEGLVGLLLEVLALLAVAVATPAATAATVARLAVLTLLVPTLLVAALLTVPLLLVALAPVALSALVAALLVAAGLVAVALVAVAVLTVAALLVALALVAAVTVLAATVPVPGLLGGVGLRGVVLLHGRDGGLGLGLVVLGRGVGGVITCVGPGLLGGGLR